MIQYASVFPPKGWAGLNGMAITKTGKEKQMKKVSKAVLGFCLVATAIIMMAPGGIRL